MKISKKLIIMSMLVMLICCVTAVSATDMESTDDVSEDITADEVTDVVEEVNIDDTQDDVADEGNLREGANSVTITNDNYTSCFSASTGYMSTTTNLIFVGTFDNKTFGNFKINSAIEIDATNAIFNNVGFDFTTSNIVFNGGTFISNENATNGAVMTITSSYISVSNTTINITAPENQSYYAFDLSNANDANLLNNTIYYYVNYSNTAYYNYVVKIKGGARVNMVGNTIVSSVPLKDVDYTNYTTRFPSIDLDLVAGVAVESCDSFNFKNNKLNVTGNRRAGWYPTLSALIIVKSDNVNVTDNTIYEGDIVTAADQANFLYAIDIYRCNNILIDNNKIDLNSQSGNLTVNGTGAAYGIQLTGPHTGVVISNNNITTANNGPNLGIYSQNSQGSTSLTITGNRINVTGKAGDNAWALVSGMELQDTYANVTGNIINVNNTAGYNSSYYAFGISYAQYISGSHEYNIQSNTVTIYNGDYAIYLLNETDIVTGQIIFNTVTASGNNTEHGNKVIFAPFKLGINF